VIEHTDLLNSIDRPNVRFIKEKDIEKVK